MTSNETFPTALIAEDEPLLAEQLRAALSRTWPELRICAMVDNGIRAVQEALATYPDILFFDIRMPGQSGLEAAAELADAWPVSVRFPALVFVTAYEEYAIEAFDAQAIDYVLKPVQSERLARTVQRLRENWSRRCQESNIGDALDHAVHQLQKLHTQSQSQQQNEPNPLQFLQATVGKSIHLVPVQDIVYLEAADKYVRVLTQGREYLLRTALKDLLPHLDAQQFWQVHRGTVVRAASIARIDRDEAGRLWIALRERPEKIAVSRIHASRFKSM
ncbi:LytR/AlgR family response regulator transcription factor [Diaphorobacter aerolatus]|uniref:Response regulator transcription factor n=1 Tax=Diaphorobacter aerolatus TaxID=1288495 RepID=A0A7H0GIK1_9BURK|nr:LytTR family DNA-binding domain-containing protein [Diaphorobacter aerolatus]QNP48117.1 response regulator transcription factor [Diaphorobacter aerolatus]